MKIISVWRTEQSRERDEPWVSVWGAVVGCVCRSRGGAIYRSPHMESYQVDRYDSQEFELTLRYRFNAAKSKYKGTGAGTGELERL